MSPKRSPEQIIAEKEADLERRKRRALIAGSPLLGEIDSACRNAEKLAAMVSPDSPLRELLSNAQFSLRDALEAGIEEARKA